MFTFENDPIGLETHIYITREYKGNPKETEEMKPEWFKYQDIPFSQMWSDDHHWFPNVLQNNRFMGYFHFAQDHKTILTQRLDANIHDHDLLERFSFEQVM